MDLYDMTIKELQALRISIENNPANQQKDSLFLYTHKARRKLNDIDWAITSKLGGFKGNGYSGRISKR